MPGGVRGLSFSAMASGSSVGASRGQNGGKDGGATAAGGGGKNSPSLTLMRQQIILDRLRAKSNHFRTFPELSKAVRTAVLDRRFSLDSEEKAILQKCLDSLQEKIPVRWAFEGELTTCGIRQDEV